MGGGAWYGLLLMAGVVVSGLLWGRLLPRGPERGVMVMVYACGLLGALLGAKLVYLLVEWPVYLRADDVLMAVLYGKTVTGALLGGYLGVEAGKRLIGYVGATGDLFAVVVPVGLVFGRVGCWISGCCLGRVCPAGAWYAMADVGGVARYPAAVVEGGFNMVTVVVLGWLYRRGFVCLRGQLFHVYLIGYGWFRLLHEVVRETPRMAGGVTGYQLVAVAMVLFGGWRFWVRRCGAGLIRGAAPVGG